MFELQALKLLVLGTCLIAICGGVGIALAFCGAAIYRCACGAKDKSDRG